MQTSGRLRLRACPKCGGAVERAWQLSEGHLERRASLVCLNCGFDLDLAAERAESERLAVRDGKLKGRAG